LNKLWTWPFLVLLGWAVMSCRFNEAARADVPESNLNEAFFDALRPVVERGIVRGELRPDIDAELLLETLIAPLHGRLLLTGEPVDERLGERIVDLVLQGACQAPSSAHLDNQ
jgi:hypothetical protein